MAESNSPVQEDHGDDAAGAVVAPVRDALPAGTSFGPYLIERLLGAGGMGEVYLARDTRLKRKVALKLLGGEFRRNDDVMRRFSQEALSASALHHTSIPVVYETGEFDTRRFIASEFVDGEALSERLKQGPLPWRQAVAIALDVSHGLEAAHAAGIVHRDIKPGNILVCPDGRAKLVDFGIAKFAEAASDPVTGRQNATRVGVVLGTPGYMSPEQGLGLPADARSDLWSLAGVLHECLTGQRVGLGRPDELRAHRIPRPLAAVIERGLRADPDVRYQSAAEFSSALQRAARRARYPLGQPWLAGAALALLLALPLAWWWRATPGHAGLRPTTLVVLPFDNLGGSADSAYFSSGIQEEILAHLARISGLTVLAPHAARDMPARPTDLRKVGLRLGVGAALEGSVQLEGDRIRVAVQLIETESGRQLWADSYNRDRRDVFDVERDVAEQVADHLRTALLPGERLAVELAETRNPEAHAALLQGDFFQSHGDMVSIEKAVLEYRRAVALDPGYANAYAQLSIALRDLMPFRPAAQQKDMEQEVRAAALKAVTLAPDLSAGHVALGWILLYTDWDLNGATREFEAASRLAPNSARSKTALGVLYSAMGRLDRAAPLFEEACRLDPVSGGYVSDLALVRWAQGRNAEAERLLHAALDLEPAMRYDHRTLAMLALERGDRALAAREAELESDHLQRDFARTVLAQGADRKRADAALGDFIARYGENTPFLVAQLYAIRKQADISFQWLDRAYRTRDSTTLDFLFTPPLFALRTDPRYARFAAELLKGVGKS